MSTSFYLPPVTKGFLVDVVTGESLKFQFNPNEFNISRTPVWASIGIPGLSHPKMQYISGGDKKISFTLEFFSDEAGRRDVKRKMDWLESLTYPDLKGNTNLKRGAHPVLLNFGELFKNVKCAVTNYTAKPTYMFDPTSLLPLRASIDLELTEIIDGAGKSYSQVRKGL